jgi:hypothetical protein
MSKYKQIVLPVFAFLVGLFLSNSLSAQLSPAFTMSSVGIIGNTNSNATAISFKSVANCLDVQSGIAVLNGTRSNGQFVTNCDVNVKFNTLGIKLFPNPVISSTKIKFINTPPLNENFNVSVWTMEGGIVFSRKETGYSIFQGVIVDMGMLIAGSYILKIESANYADAIKFIKAN